MPLAARSISGASAVLPDTTRLHQFTGPNGDAVPGTFRDSLYLLAVVLEQETELQPTEIMTDTAGHTDTIFGIFLLLGLQFNPHLADIGGARFWRADSKADYGIDGLSIQWTPLLSP